MHVLNIKVIYSNILEQIITVINPHDNNTIYWMSTIYTIYVYT